MPELVAGDLEVDLVDDRVRQAELLGRDRLAAEDLAVALVVRLVDVHVARLRADAAVLLVHVGEVDLRARRRVLDVARRGRVARIRGAQGLRDDELVLRRVPERVDDQRAGGERLDVEAAAATATAGEAAWDREARSGQREDSSARAAQLQHVPTSQ
jgi:hypothetical protein